MPGELHDTRRTRAARWLATLPALVLCAVSAGAVCAVARALRAGLLAVASASLAAGPAASAAALVVVDDLGREVRLAAPAQRIISLAPHNTENLFSAGAGDKIVGAIAHSDYPPAARALQSIGQHPHISLEALLSLAPDLVVAWASVSTQRELLEQLQAWGVAVYHSEPRDFEAILGNIEDLARLAGTREKIHPPLAQLREEVARVRARYAGRAAQTVFYQVWSEPLMTLNGAHFVSRALEVCGARNIFAALPILAPRVSVEAVVRANPDLIITGLVAGQKPDLSAWKKWSWLKAVERENFVFVDSAALHRHTARMLLSLRALCEQIDGVRAKNFESAAGAASEIKAPKTTGVNGARGAVPAGGEMDAVNKADFSSTTDAGREARAAGAENAPNATGAAGATNATSAESAAAARLRPGAGAPPPRDEKPGAALPR